MVFTNDLRWRVVYMRFALRYPFQLISALLDISEASVRRVIGRFNVYGDVSPNRIGRPDISTVLAPPQLYVVMEYVLQHPKAFVKEMIQHLIEITGSACEAESLRLVLRRNGFTRKRLKKVSARKRYHLVDRFKQVVSVYRPEELVFLDESFYDRSISRNYGWQFSGHPAFGQYMPNKGPRTTVMAAISYESGLLALEMNTDNFDGAQFTHFLRRNLVPSLRPYDGINPNSVVVMDNHAAHHIPQVEQIIRNSGAHILYLPPYSPELNPIEGMFSLSKCYLREDDDLFMTAPVYDMHNLIIQSFLDISLQKLQYLYGHCGY